MYTFLLMITIMIAGYTSYYWLRHLRNNSKKGLGDLLFIVCNVKSNGDKQLSHQLKWQCVYCRVIALLSHLLLSAILSKTYYRRQVITLATAELPRSAMNFPAQYNQCKSQDHSYLPWMGLCNLSLTATASQFAYVSCCCRSIQWDWFVWKYKQ